MTTSDTDDLEDLLPDTLGAKGRAQPLRRTPAQSKAAAARQKKTEREALDKANAQRLAQIVNLHIAGHSLADIGASIGATADEVDRMLAQDAQRYVRSQPALRVFVRNYISEKYSGLLEAVWDEATDKSHGAKLEHQDRALRILDKMARLHGAEAPTQAEVTVDAAPETVERMVAALAAGQGQGYDMTVFDVIEGEVVSEEHDRAVDRLAVSGNAVAEPQEGDTDGI